MLYLQVYFSLMTILLWFWTIPIYLLLVKSIALDDCIKNNITTILECYSGDYDYSERSLSFCLGSQIGFSILISIVTLLTFCSKCCFEEACSYEVKLYDKYKYKSNTVIEQSV